MALTIPSLYVGKVCQERTERQEEVTILVEEAFFVLGLVPHFFSNFKNFVLVFVALYLLGLGDPYSIGDEVFLTA